ncbi:MAG: isoaspartyl peptidase/L-asparaginase family protein [Phycisphaerales bacterium]
MPAHPMWLLIPILLLLGACAAQSSPSTAPAAAAPLAPAPGGWAIAIHGGAGVLDRVAPAAERDAYIASLTAALNEGQRRLAAGESAMDVCEAVVRILEDDPKFNAGKGAAYNAEGKHELDASIMDGKTLNCGAVAAVRTVKNPISLARLVMTRTNNVLLMGDGAEQFADAMGVEHVPNTYFDTPKRLEFFEEWQREQKAKQPQTPPAGSGKGTVGCVCLDTSGNLAAATSTGGLTGKRFGRVGDSPIIGAGCYANNASCAVSCTGTGEQFIRHTVARNVAALMEYGNLNLRDAAARMVFVSLKPDDGGLIAVSAAGEIALVYNSEGMFRGAANSKGHFEVKIWE